MSFLCNEALAGGLRGSPRDEFYTAICCHPTRGYHALTAVAEGHFVQVGQCPVAQKNDKTRKHNTKPKPDG